jgi:sodium transport system ATP-binding protein
MVRLRDPEAVEVLDGVSLEVDPGSVVCLMGANGSGKTTLLRLCAGVLLPDSGAVAVEGSDPAASPPARRSVGFLSSSERSFYWRLPARRNLLFWGSLQGLFGAGLRRAVDRATELAGCSDFLEHRFEDLSTGMRQKVGLARAIMHSPRLLLLDEPTRSMDAESAEAFAGLIRRLADDGAAVVMATHSGAEAASLGHRTLRLEAGGLREVDARREAGPRVRIRFSGTPRTPPPGRASASDGILTCPAGELGEAVRWLEGEDLRIGSVETGEEDR